MFNTRTFNTFILSIIFVFLTGCAEEMGIQETDTPTEIPSDIPTLIPTLTSTTVPTFTPEPTFTPLPPTQTPTPPEIITEYLNSVRITKVDNFDIKVGWDLYAGEIENGVLEIVGKDWNGLRKGGKFTRNSGIIIQFKYEEKSEFEIFYDYEKFYTDEYRRFGIYVQSANPSTNLWLGKNGLGFNYMHGNFSTEPDTWYSLLMAIGDNGEFLAVIWDPNDPSRIITYHEMAGEKWAGYNWDFRIGANKGIIQFDNYMKIVFESIK